MVASLGETNPSLLQEDSTGFAGVLDSLNQMEHFQKLSISRWEQFSRISVALQNTLEWTWAVSP
jgi:hypothetical protein